MKTRVVLALALCAACFGGKRPDYEYFVLRSSNPMPRPTSPSGGSEQRELVVDAVTIPGYLDREQIAVRTADHHVEYSTRDRWAEPIDQAFERTLREELAARLTQSGIHVQPRGGVPTYALSVDVLRFERIGAAQIELWARWVLRSQTDALDSGEIRLRLPMSARNSNAMASALSDAIARMATQIAARVRETDMVATRERDE